MPPPPLKCWVIPLGTICVAQPEALEARATLAAPDNAPDEGSNIMYRGRAVDWCRARRLHRWQDFPLSLRRNCATPAGCTLVRWLSPYLPGDLPLHPGRQPLTRRSGRRFDPDAHADRFSAPAPRRPCRRLVERYHLPTLRATPGRPATCCYEARRSLRSSVPRAFWLQTRCTDVFLRYRSNLL